MTERRPGPPPIPMDARRPSPPPLPAEVRKPGPPPIPPDIKRNGPPPIPNEAFKVPEVSKHVERVTYSFCTPELTQKEPVAFVHSTDERNALELSFGLKKGIKRETKDRGEDSLFYDPETGIGGVCDGLGDKGDGQGADASLFVSKNMRMSYVETRKKFANEPITEDSMRNLIARQLEGKNIDMFHPNFQVLLEQELPALLALPPEVQRELVLLEQATELTHQKLVAENAKNTREKRTLKDGKTTVSFGKTVTLADGRRFEVSCQVGDGKVMVLDGQGNSKNLIPEHSLETILRAQGEDIDAPGYTFTDKDGNKLDKKAIATRMTSSLGRTDSRFVRPFVHAEELSAGQTAIYTTDGVGDIESKQKEMSKRIAAAPPEDRARIAFEVIAEDDTKGDDQGILAKTVKPRALEQKVQTPVAA